MFAGGVGVTGARVGGTVTTLVEATEGGAVVARLDPGLGVCAMLALVLCETRTIEAEARPLGPYGIPGMTLVYFTTEAVARPLGPYGIPGMTLVCVATEAVGTQY